MLEWMLTGFDTTRPHTIDMWVSWHARLNYIAWVIVVPLGIIIARFFKVLSNQDWPNELDNQVWWRCHWIGQTFAILLSFVALLMLKYAGVAINSGADLHRVFGYIVLTLGFMQLALGLFRGSKGGPADPLPDGSLLGDHYRMSQWRRAFEFAHKSIGYIAVLVAAITVLSGLWETNAPRWMWFVTAGWWLFIALWFSGLQKRGRALDTYQAIWGPGAEHPGNRLPAAGWGTRRAANIEELKFGKSGIAELNKEYHHE